MISSIVTGIVVLVIIVFAVFAVVSLRDKDRETEKKGESGNSKVKDILDKIRPVKPVPADAPKIYIRTKPNEPYTEYKMKKSRITIGRKNCDINIDSAIVENRHIIIEKHMTDNANAMYYVLQNCSRINPVAYRDRIAQKHVFMNYNETVVLSGRDVFHIGTDIKIGTKTQEINYVDTPSDRERDKKDSASKIMWEYRNSFHQNSEWEYNDNDIKGI